MLSQTIVLSLRGIPGIYIHSLLATPNDHMRVEVTGSTRSINRHQWNLDEISALLEVYETGSNILMKEYTRRIHIRRQQPAFHPDAEQWILDLEDGLIGIMRVAKNGQKIVALYNFTQGFITLNDAPLRTCLDSDRNQWKDLLRKKPLIYEAGLLKLKPYACHWLTVKEERRMAKHYL